MTTRDALVRYLREPGVQAKLATCDVGTLAALCQRLGVSGRGTREELIRSVLKVVRSYTR